MRHCRTDYDAIQPWPTKRPHIVRVDGRTTTTEEWVGSPEWITSDSRPAPLIPDDEPVFVVRAMDEVGPSTVRAWAEFARAHGADQSVCDRVLRWAGEMAAYAAEHGGPKVPDVPAGALLP